jgi:uncharacterized delta-60 repeat protein
MSASRCVRRLVFGAAAVLLAVFVLPALAAGAAGDLDPSWGGTGFVTTSFPGAYSFSNGVVVREDRVVAVGGVQSLTGDFAIAAYRRNGSLDTSFGTGGRVTTDFNGGDDLATAAAYQGDKLVVVGYTSPAPNTYYFAIARYNRDGTLDQSFGNAGKVVTNFGDGYDFADAVAIRDDKIVVAGESRRGGGGDNFALARYTRKGLLDSSFGSGGTVTTDFNGLFDSANGVTFVDDKIVVAGYVQKTDFNFGLASYRQNGTLDQSFGNGGKVETDFGHGNDYAHAIDVKGERIVAVGSATNASASPDFAAAEYNERGAPLQDFGSGGKATIDLGGDDQAFGGKFQRDGKVVAAGGTPFGGFGDHFGVARFTRHGSPDPSFGPGTGFVTTLIGTSSAAFGMDLGPDQKIVAAGYSDNNFAVARYLGDGRQDCGECGGGGDHGSGPPHDAAGPAPSSGAAPNVLIPSLPPRLPSP